MVVRGVLGKILCLRGGVLLVSAALVSLSGCTGRIGANEPSVGIDDPGPGTPPAPPPVVPPPVEEPDPPPFAPLPSLTRRLSQDEFAHTIEDVVGVTLTAVEKLRLPADRPLAGFARTAVGQTTLPDHVLAYADLAETIVGRPAFGDFIGQHADCSELERGCAEAFIRSAGARLFRRPVTSDEVSAYADLFVAVAVENDFDRSIRAVAQAMLQSPQFLYLLETEAGSNPRRTIDGYEVASRLSYALWSSAPDAELYAAAASGALDTAEGVVTQATRMLAVTDKVRRGRERFLLDWARLESLPDDDGLRQALIDSAQQFYLTYVDSGNDLFDIFSAPTAHLTPALAEAWGLTSAGDGIRTYETSGFPGRVGLLAQPGVVAGMTNADGGAIVARGLFLQAQLFCEHPPDPPASLQEIIDEFIAEQRPDASDREIADIRLERGACGACHSQFDPLAFGFEHFDYRGGYRTEDEHGNRIQIDGWIPGALIAGDNQPYSTFETYMAALGDTVRVRRCLVQRQLEFLLGRQIGSDQEAAVRALTEAVAAGGGRLDALILAAVADPLFLSAGPSGE